MRCAASWRAPCGAACSAGSRRSCRISASTRRVFSSGISMSVWWWTSTPHRFCTSPTTERPPVLRAISPRSARRDYGHCDGSVGALSAPRPRPRAGRGREDRGRQVSCASTRRRRRGSRAESRAPSAARRRRHPPLPDQVCVAQNPRELLDQRVARLHPRCAPAPCNPPARGR